MAKEITENEGVLKASVAMHPLWRIEKPEEITSTMAFLLGAVSDLTKGGGVGSGWSARLFDGAGRPSLLFQFF